MPRHRNSSNRPDHWRGGRYQTGSARDRYRTGGEQRFRPDWDEHEDSGFEGNRAYSSGGYSEEFGYRGPGNPQERYRYGSRARDTDAWRGSAAPWDRDRRGAGGSRFDSPDERSRWLEASQGEHGDRDLGGAEFYSRDRSTPTTSWHEDLGDRGGYFGTGNYIDAGDAWRGFGHDMERARLRAQRERASGGVRQPPDAGDYSHYGRSFYGSRQWHEQDPGSWGPPRYGQPRSWESRAPGSMGPSAPSFRGRGPRGYQRSDERLQEMICELLTDDPDIDASNVNVEVSGQCVRLTGTVEDRSTKYQIEELVEGCGGLKDIDNQLRVRPSQPGDQPGRLG